MRKSLFFIIIYILFPVISGAENYQLARRLQPEEGEFKQKKSSFQDFNQAEKFYNNKRYDDALTIYKNYIHNYPESNLYDNAVYRIAQIYFLKEQYKEAGDYYQIIVEKNTASELLRESEYFLGVCYLSTENYLGAITILNKFINVYKTPKKRLGEAYFYKAKALNGKGDPLAAIEEYFKAKKITEGKETLAEINSDLKMIVEKNLKIEELINLIGKYPQDEISGNALHRLATLYLEAKDYENYKSTMEKFIHKYPQNEFSAQARQSLEEIKGILKGGKIQIGVVLPLTGKMSGVGTKVLQGIKLAFESYQAEMADKPKKIEFELIIKDSLEEPENVARQIEELAKDNRVIIIIGPLLTRSVQAALPVVNKYTLPLFSSAATGKDINKANNYFFRNALTNENQIKTITDYAVKKLMLKKYAVLYPENNYGRELREYFIRFISDSGGEIVNEGTYKEEVIEDLGESLKKIGGMNDHEFKAAIKKLEKEGFDLDQAAQKLKPKYEAVFIPGFADKVGLIISQLHYYNIRGVKILGTSGWNSPDLIRIAGRSAEGVVFADGFFADSSHPKVIEFVKNYKEKFSEDPDIFSAQSFDAANIILNVFKGEIKTRKEVRKALIEVTNYDGISGLTSILPTGDTTKRIFLLTVSDGEIKEIE